MNPSNDERRLESSTPPNPSSIVDSLLDEADQKRRQQAEDCQVAAQRARRLGEQQALRQRLADAFGLAYRFTNEETEEEGRKPSADGFQRWAKRFLAVGAVMRECDAAIDGLHLLERLRTAAARPAPAAMTYACALLWLAAEGDGQADDVASALERANDDGELRRLVLWLPFILDHLWWPFPGEDGRTQVSLSPQGTSLADHQQAEEAFGWRLPALDVGLEETRTVSPCPTVTDETAPADSTTRQSEGGTPPSNGKPDGVDQESLAIALLFQRPDWSVAAIAQHVGVDRQTPYKWEHFRIAAELKGTLKPRGAKGRTPHRGHKTSTGQVEAYAEEDDE